MAKEMQSYQEQQLMEVCVELEVIKQKLSHVKEHCESHETEPTLEP